MPKQISVTDARQLLDQGAIYVDVRSTVEFEMSHPAGAINIPLLHRDPASGQMSPNPDFVRVMQATFPPETNLLIGCQVGGRSMRAAQVLESFGFTNLSNVKGGFGGMKDPMGRTVDPGWAESGLPVDAGAPEGRSYAHVAAKAGIDE
jgi:rhodanese-related sulfurtransferase